MGIEPKGASGNRGHARECPLHRVMMVTRAGDNAAALIADGGEKGRGSPALDPTGFRI